MINDVLPSDYTPFAVQRSELTPASNLTAILKNMSDRSGTVSGRVVGQAALSYLDGLVEQLRGYVPAALRDFEPAAIHQGRVATRRLGAAIGLLTPILDKSDVKPFRKLLKKLRGKLGPHRDLDVLIEEIAEVGKQEPQHSPAVDFLLRTLRSRRDALRGETNEQGGVNRIIGKLGLYDGIRLALAEGVDGFEPLIAEGVHEGFDEFGALADLLSHSLAEKEGLNGLDPHELRIAGKHLRYSLELAEAGGVNLPSVGSGQGGDPSTSVLKLFKKMQDSLGLWHDHVVLAETAMQVLQQHQLTHSDAALGAAVLRFSAAALDRADAHLSDFGRLWIEKGQAVGRLIQHAFPLSRDVGPVKHTGSTESVGQDLAIGQSQTHTLP